MAEFLQIETAAILAGGRGVRLRPVLAGRPKVLAPIGGRPFLARVLDQLTVAGVKRVVLCTGFLAEQVEQAFGSRYDGLSLVYSREPEPLDTGGALGLALEHFDSDPLLALNGDSFCEVDFSAMAGWHRWKRSEATIALCHLSDATRFGSVTWTEHGRITSFEEKGREGSGWINAGVYLLSPEVLQSMEVGACPSLERDCFPALARHGRLYGFPGGRRFLDIGTPESYATAQAFFSSGQSNHQGNDRAHVLVDRDGTLVVERGYLSGPAGTELLPGAVEAVALLQKMGLGVTVITNQSGVARGYFDRERVDSIHARLRDLLEEGGARLDGIYYCPHEPKDNCGCRKPAPGLVFQAAADICFDPKRSFVIGDKLCDIELGKVVGATTFLVRTGYGEQLPERIKAGADYVVADLWEAAKVIEKLLDRESAVPGVATTAGEGNKAIGTKEEVRTYLLDAAETLRRTAENGAESVVAAAQMIAGCLRKGGKLLICGNGGSAAQCQHMAAELVSALNKQVLRPGMAAVALTTDTSILTAIGNDFGFADVFARQVDALGRSGDVLLAISTSGISENAVRAAQAASRKALKVVALVGPDESVLVRAADLAIRVPSEDTQHIQEAQLAVEHLLCLLVEEDLFGGEKA